MAEVATLEVDRFRFAAGLLAGMGQRPDPSLGASLETRADEQTPDERFVCALAALVWNVEPVAGRLVAGRIQEVVLAIDRMIAQQLDAVLHEPRVQALEASWRALADLVHATNFRANITVDILDASKEELYEDFDASAVDITESVLFKKVYTSEFDQFGGKPFGLLLGLYEFTSTPRDLLWLRQAAKVAAISHAPFVSAVSPRFFGFDTAEQLSGARDIEGLLRHPRYGAWQTFRDTQESAYVALTLPRYLLRKPWTPELAPGADFPYTEDTGADGRGFLWGNPSVLFARVIVRAYERTGWCQTIRGPHGGGLITGLVDHSFRVGGEKVRKPAVEITIPDWAELSFARAGFIPLLARPESPEVCVFSCQSVKAPKTFKNVIDSERSQLHANLAYTLSAAQIAHYLKCIVRDSVGSTADAAYIQRRIRKWLEGYVTTIANPDDLTLRFYPFKDARVAVEKADGIVGKYNCLVAVAPHIQFEGIDIELRLESRVG